MKLHKLISTVDMSHEEWLRYRKLGIGGSDAGSICGLNPYSSAIAVFQDKTQKEAEEKEDNEAMRQGRDLEEYVARRFMEETGKSLVLRKIAEEKNGGKPIKVVANLPYYITTPIIMGLFENQVPVDSITIMVQKEVADRMQVGPGTKDYGALSLAVQYYAKPKIVANVPPNCFMPRPKVGSAVIRLKRHAQPVVNVSDEKLMFRLIRASFNQRRKTLANGLKNSPELDYTKEEIEAAIEALGRGASIRGEALTLEEFAKLADLLSECRF